MVSKLAIIPNQIQIHAMAKKKRQVILAARRTVPLPGKNETKEQAQRTL